VQKHRAKNLVKLVEELPKESGAKPIFRADCVWFLDQPAFPQGGAGFLVNRAMAGLMAHGNPAAGVESFPDFQGRLQMACDDVAMGHWLRHAGFEPGDWASERFAGSLFGGWTGDLLRGNASTVPQCRRSIINQLEIPDGSHPRLLLRVNQIALLHYGRRFVGEGAIAAATEAMENANDRLRLCRAFSSFNYIGYISCWEPDVTVPAWDWQVPMRATRPRTRPRRKMKWG
jgi:hypothetical protein